jgi:hypothetical protein
MNTILYKTTTNLIPANVEVLTSPGQSVIYKSNNDGIFP